jgi:hypothetical protein
VISWIPPKSTNLLPQELSEWPLLTLGIVWFLTYTYAHTYWSTSNCHKSLNRSCPLLPPNT